MTYLRASYKVSPVLSFSILPMAPMSPQVSSLTSSVFFPFIKYRRPSFSFCPVRALIRVDIRGERTGDDLHQRVFAVLVGYGFEHKGGGDGASGDDELHGLAIFVQSLERGGLGGGGQQVYDGVEQGDGAQAGIGRPADDGDQGPRCEYEPLSVDVNLSNT